MSKGIKGRGNAFFRWLDRYAGIPLVCCLKIFSQKAAAKPEELDKVALIKMGAIGDSILTSPLIYKLHGKLHRKLHRKKALHLTVICGKNNSVVYENLLAEGYVNRLIEIEFNRLIFDWAYLYRKIKEIKQYHFNLCMDLDSWYRISALICFLVRADYKVGFKTANQSKHQLFDDCKIHDNTNHEFENYKKLAEPYVGKISAPPAYPLSKGDSVIYEEFMEAHHIENYIIIHPWASGYKNARKELSINALAYVGNTLAAKGFNVIISGGKEDMEKSKQLSALITDSLSIAGKTTLNETAVFLQHAACVITVNTGILHLAAAVGADIVCINGPTDVNRWGALSDKAINITSSLFCSPCLNLGFEYKCKQNGVPAGHCMKKIDLDEVVNAAVGMASMEKKAL